MKKILFISINQFGYNTDLFKFSEYLSDEYSVDYLCFDTGYPKIVTDKCNVIYIKRSETGTLTRLILATESIKHIHKNKPDYVFIKYFAGCSLIKFFCKNSNLIVDIRTATIHSDERIRRNKDKILTMEANLFKNISVISEGLIDRLSLKRDKCFVLPLGADRMIKCDKKTQKRKMSLLYVGIFDQRNIEETIEGFSEFYNKYKYDIECDYTIIGYGYNKKYEETVCEAISRFNLAGVVKFIGRKKYDELGQFFENHNIGVSYVPLTDYFEHQPPTKTYEYIRNGLICIATDTLENRKIINEYNGVLISDNAESFCKGLEQIYRNLEFYDSASIMSASERYSWRNIVKTTLKPRLLKLKTGR